MRGSLVVLLVFLVVLFAADAALAGSVFISGHDAIWHAHNGANSAGATNIATTGIEYARAGSTVKFLFIESKTTAVPGGNYRTEPYLISDLGYTSSDYDYMDAADLLALSDFRTTLDSYSAIIIPSDHGGMLTGAELGFLNSHSADILDYINNGGGVAAFAESNAQGLITGNTPFGFLPFLVSSTSFGSFESGNTVTAFGALLGLTNSDVNGNFSHNYFSATGGMTPVDLFNGDSTKVLSLAFTGQFGTTGVNPVPLPTAVWPGVVLLAGLFFVRLRRRRNVA